MVAKVSTVAFSGIEIKEVEVQAHIAAGLPTVNIVGLPDKAVGESKERVRAAFQSIGFGFPQKKITINLAPADLFKEGSHYDLALALGILAELKIITENELAQYFVVGELSLDGSINAVSGVLPAAIGANAHGKGLICPAENGSEATWSGNKDIVAPKTLLELTNHLKCEQTLPYPAKTISNDNGIQYPDLKDVKGQKIAKRALEITAAGGHNMLMIGPPGSGKSMLAKRLPGLLPPLTTKEMLETSIIASIAGLLKEQNIIRNRPFRDPHNSSSMPALVGGGKNAKPGEVTLAHLGVLFLDELPEFPRNVLDALRQPIETGEITIARVNSHITYPARFQLIAAMNPCKCGFFGDNSNACSKIPKCAQDYQSKISGPLLDRFDIRIEVPSVNVFEVEDQEEPESSTTIAKRVYAARNIQMERYKDEGITLNSHADGELLDKHTLLSEDSLELLRKAVDKFSLSMRGYNRVLRIARTIADLGQSQQVDISHIAEALSYRTMKVRA
jgi:magnesium chelatase family protein